MLTLLGPHGAVREEIKDRASGLGRRLYRRVHRYSLNRTPYTLVDAMPPVVQLFLLFKSLRWISFTTLSGPDRLDLTHPIIIHSSYSPRIL